jgi:hypothetical protein
MMDSGYFSVFTDISPPQPSLHRYTHFLFSCFLAISKMCIVKMPATFCASCPLQEEEIITGRK